MPQHTKLLLFALLLLPLAPAFGKDNASLPTWAEAVAVAPATTYPTEAKAVVLLDETAFAVTSATDAIETHHRAVLILRPTGREEGELDVMLKEGDKLVSAHLWSRDRVGHIFEVKQEEMTERGLFAGFELYSDLQALTAKAPAAEPGTVVYSEYQVRRHVLIPQEHWFPQENIPVLYATYTLDLPTGWKFQSGWANHDSVTPVEPYAGRWIWTLKNLSAILGETEHYSPAEESLMARMALAYGAGGEAQQFSTWNGIAAWEHRLASTQQAITPEMRDKVATLLAGKITFDARLRAITSFIQRDIRYVAVEIGIGGFQPHAAPETYGHRYGDCKDKANLLAVLLRETGIQAELVDVDSEHGVVKSDLPSTLFNHAILAIAIPADAPAEAYRSVVQVSDGKRYIIFDPTDEYTPIGEIRPALQGNWALIISEKDGQIVQIPVFPPESNPMERNGKFVLSTDGTLSGEVTTRLGGWHGNSDRMLLHARSEEKIQQGVTEILAQQIKEPVVSNLNFQNRESSLQPLISNYHLTAKNYLQQSGPYWLLRNRVLGEKSLGIALDKRRYPIVLPEVTDEKDNYEIALPEDLAVDELPPPVKIDLGFASYESSVEANGNTVLYRREYKVRRTELSLAEIKQFEQLQLQIGGDEQACTLLKK